MQAVGCEPVDARARVASAQPAITGQDPWELEYQRFPEFTPGDGHRPIEADVPDVHHVVWLEQLLNTPASLSLKEL